MNPSKLLTSWSKEQTLFLLQELQNHPVLYDQTHPLYQFRAQRIAALRTIALKIRPFKPNMTSKLISTKIRSIKSQYCNEKKHIRDSLVNLKPGEKPYKSKLWCFDILKFLDQKGTYDKDAPPLPLPEYEDEDEEGLGGAIDDISSDQFNDPIKSFEDVEIERAYFSDEIETENGQTRNALHSKCLKLLNCLTQEMKTVKEDNVIGTGVSTQQSPNTFLGLMVESELSKAPEEIYDEAKWKIIRILEEAAKKNREMKMRSAQIKLPSTSATNSSSASIYNVGSDTRLTILDTHMLKTPIQTPTGSKIIMISRPKQNE